MTGAQYAGGLIGLKVGSLYCADVGQEVKCTSPTLTDRAEWFDVLCLGACEGYEVPVVHEGLFPGVYKCDPCLC